MGLDAVDLILSVEKHYGIDLPQDAAEKMLTVGDMHGFVIGQLRKIGNRQIDPDIIFHDLQALICRTINIEPDKITLLSRFVEDLHIDQ